ncbi:hypothetical protein INR49_016214, partial [Caranx melampygus]
MCQDKIYFSIVFKVKCKVRLTDDITAPHRASHHESCSCAGPPVPGSLRVACAPCCESKTEPICCGWLSELGSKLLTPNNILVKKDSKELSGRTRWELKELLLSHDWASVTTEPWYLRFLSKRQHFLIQTSLWQLRYCYIMFELCANRASSSSASLR